jgi:soluble lytic murein transglycosylase-like protein
MSKRLDWRTALLRCTLLLAPAPARPALTLDLAGTAWATAAAPYALDPTLLYAIGLMESGRPRDGGVAPWPWTLYLPGQGGVFLANREQALSILRANVDTAVDVGLMQVNLRWHGHRVAQLEDLLEPARNIEIAAAILAEALATTPGDLELGIGRYHSPGEQRARAYGRTVLTIQEGLRQLASGARR